MKIYHLATLACGKKMLEPNIVKNYVGTSQSLQPKNILRNSLMFRQKNEKEKCHSVFSTNTGKSHQEPIL
jgi:hypothetical protein